MARSRFRRRSFRRRTTRRRRPIRRRKGYRRRPMRRRPSFRRRTTATRRAAVKTMSRWYRIDCTRVDIPQSGYSSVGHQVVSLGSSAVAMGDSIEWNKYKISKGLIKYTFEGELGEWNKIGTYQKQITTGVDVSYEQINASFTGLKILTIKDTDGYRAETTAGQMYRDPRCQVRLLKVGGTFSQTWPCAAVAAVYAGEPQTSMSWKEVKGYFSTDYPATRYYGLTIGIVNDSLRTFTGVKLAREIWIKVTWKGDRVTRPRRVPLVIPTDPQLFTHALAMTTPAAEPADATIALPVSAPVNPAPDDLPSPPE